MSEEVMYKLDRGHNDWWMKAFIITMHNNNQSMVSTRKLIQSIYATESLLQPFIMPATTPETMLYDLEMAFPKSLIRYLMTADKKLRYTWPIHSSQDGLDISTGLYKRAYAAKDWRKVASCSISHMRLWQHCIDIDEPILILEHDAYFDNFFSYKNIVLAGQQSSDESMQWTGGICGINDPSGATRKSRVFMHKVKDQVKDQQGLALAPYVDDPGDLPLPCGLAGNSAYIIKPWAAKKLLEKTAEVGIWPNDALMCRQFFPWLQVYHPFITKIQNTPSTTTS
jgi:GR25 family glycosyltransferase involved in LPS biosynthesis